MELTLNKKSYQLKKLLQVVIHRIHEVLQTTLGGNPTVVSE